MITLNGKPREGARMSLEELLKTEGFNRDQVVVGLNGQVAPREDHSTLILKDGDKVEIFQFMGGG